MKMEYQPFHFSSFHDHLKIKQHFQFWLSLSWYPRFEIIKKLNRFSSISRSTNFFSEMCMAEDTCDDLIAIDPSAIDNKYIKIFTKIIRLLYNHVGKCISPLLGCALYTASLYNKNISIQQQQCTYNEKA